MKLWKYLKEEIILRPKIIVVLTIIFLMVSVLASLTGFEMYLNEEEILKENFKDNEMLFYFLFIVTNGISIFFLFLARALWKLKEWARYFILGSSFLSALYVIYHICISCYLMVINHYSLTETQIKLLALNFLYLIIYMGLLKYFSLPRIESQFKKKKYINSNKESNFFFVNKK